MKVVVVGSLARSLTNFRGRLLAAMVEAGHDVVAVAADEDPAVSDELAAMGIRYRAIPMRRRGLNPADDMRYAWRLYAALRNEQPSVVLAYTIKPAIYGTLAAAWARIPVRGALITGLGYAFGRTGFVQRCVGAIAGRLYGFALARVSVVFFQNPDDRDEFVARGLVRAERTTVVAGSGVDLEHFRPAPLPPGAPVFLLMARLIREKGVLEFAEAGRILAQRGTPVRLQLLGPHDPGPGAIPSAQIEAWQREGLIEYLGVATDVRPYLAACTVFVLPSSYREGTPRAALEALATGRPVITTDSPGCRETVRHGVNGFLVTAGSAEELANAMEKLARDPELRQEMAKASLRLAQERFSVHLVNATILRNLGLTVTQVGTA